MKGKSLKGRLYLITPPLFLTQDIERFLSLLPEVLSKQEVGFLQLRMKKGSFTKVLKTARSIKALCARFRVRFVVNDEVEIAKAVGSWGLHLGQNDVSVQEARKQAPEVVVSVSCHGDVRLGEKAQREGADMVSFGACYPSVTKPQAPRAKIEALESFLRTTPLMTIAIGGITAQTAPSLLHRGFHYLALSSFVFSHPLGALQAIEELSDSMRDTTP